MSRLRRFFFLLVTSYLLASVCVKANDTRVDVSLSSPKDLSCEYLNNPLGIDIRKPRLSWKIETVKENRGVKQTAYEILVASSIELIEKEQGDFWDSGVIISNESSNIVYDGRALNSNQKYYWTVRLRDQQGKWSAWSTPAYWRMGLFLNDWKAQWIGSVEMESKSAGWKPIENKMADPWLRKTFELLDHPEEAIIYVASIGYHELYINGQRVGDAVLSPSVTDHKTRARYMSYDITKFLKLGDNVIALWLGTSWSIFPHYNRKGESAIPMALAQAEITLSSNERKQIISDSTWRVHASPNQLIGYWDVHHFGGEYYDASLEIEGWNDAEFDDSDWLLAKVYTPRVLVSADRTIPNRLIKNIEPLSVTEVGSGVYRIDMGVNYSGWFEMQLDGLPGDSIVFRFSEEQEQASSFGLHSIYKIGEKGKGVFCNRFNYMTGRWVQISGLRSKPSLKQIRGWMIRPDYERTGDFKCDVPLLNEIYNASMWSFENLSLGNYVVDCPHRERCGYGGDALATTRMAMGNYDMRALYGKWMEDWRDVQGDDGNVPHTAPTRTGGGGPSWSGYCITLPWEVYSQYGDVRILSESFSTIQKWLAFVENHSCEDMLVRWGGKWGFLGDWLWPAAWPERKAMEAQGKALGDTQETLFFNNCHWIYSLETAARIADVLSETKIADSYRKRAVEIRKAVHNAFFNPQDNSYVNGYPSYLAMALHVDLPPNVLKEKVWKRLEQEILINKKGHFWGGITAGSFLFHTLMDSDRNDLIYEMVTKSDFPSWGYMIEKGNGTFFEDWECRGSGLHSSYLYVGSWFIEALGGIKRPESGSKHIVVEPYITTNGPKRVDSYYDSIYGKIVSNWSLASQRLDLRVVIPPNMTATLKLSGVQFDSIKESGREWRRANGVALEAQKDKNVSFVLQSGSYQFTAVMK